MKNNDMHVPEAMRDVFAKLTGKSRTEMVSMDQLTESEIQSVSGAWSGWQGNIHRYEMK